MNFLTCVLGLAAAMPVMGAQLQCTDGQDEKEKDGDELLTAEGGLGRRGQGRFPSFCCTSVSSGYFRRNILHKKIS